MRDVLKLGTCCVCGNRGRLSEAAMCLSCHARGSVAAEALLEWLRCLRLGLDRESDQEATARAEVLRSSLGSLSRPLGELCRLLEASSPVETIGVSEVQDGWSW
jgi:hypothetical protein